MPPKEEGTPTFAELTADLVHGDGAADFRCIAEMASSTCRCTVKISCDRVEHAKELLRDPANITLDAIRDIVNCLVCPGHQSNRNYDYKNKIERTRWAPQFPHLNFYTRRRRSKWSLSSSTAPIPTAETASELRRDDSGRACSNTQCPQGTPEQHSRRASASPSRTPDAGTGSRDHVERPAVDAGSVAEATASNTVGADQSSPTEEPSAQAPADDHLPSGQLALRASDRRGTGLEELFSDAPLDAPTVVDLGSTQEAGRLSQADGRDSSPSDVHPTTERATGDETIAGPVIVIKTEDAVPERPRTRSANTRKQSVSPIQTKPRAGGLPDSGLPASPPAGPSFSAEQSRTPRRSRRREGHPPPEVKLPLRDNSRLVFGTMCRDGAYRHSVSHNEHNLAALLMDPLTYTDKQLRGIKGWVYILRNSETKLVKIGWTTREIPFRFNELKKCWSSNCEVLVILGTDGIEPILAFKKLEKLVHADLQPHRVFFECTCGTSGEMQKITRHEEWFDVSNEVALATVHFWREFLLKDPYGQTPFNKPGPLDKFWAERVHNRAAVSKHEEHTHHKTRLRRWMVTLGMEDAIPSQIEKLADVKMGPDELPERIRQGLARDLVPSLEAPPHDSADHTPAGHSRSDPHPCTYEDIVSPAASEDVSPRMETWSPSVSISRSLVQHIEESLRIAPQDQLCVKRAASFTSEATPSLWFYGLKAIKALTNLNYSVGRSHWLLAFMATLYTIRPSSLLCAVTWVLVLQCLVEGLSGISVNMV